MKTKPDLLVINQIMPDMIREENYQGEPHYMIASATMPDDIVMNRGLYPRHEIEATYTGLQGVHAPLGHPVMDDEFISASTPYAVRNYGVGAQVANVRRENGRILHETAVNIAVANQTDRGKRLLDRIEAVKNGDNTKPIHTSIGVYLDREELDEPQVNQYGEYDWVAHNLRYDHNAILLDEVGAATPNEGTGMFVNSGNEKVDIFVLNAELENEVSEELEVNEEHKTLFKKFMEFMGFAPSIDAAYNSDVNNTTEVSDMALTTEEKAALVADISKEVTANLSQPIADAVASAVKPVADRMDTLETNAQAAEKAEKEALAEKLGLEADEVAGMSVNTLQKMAAKLDAQDTGEYGERAPVFGANSAKGDDFTTDLSAWGK
ncbi:MAG: hypothetical protein ACPHUL_00450 [Marinomonas gallaica]